MNGRKYLEEKLTREVSIQFKEMQRNTWNTRMRSEQRDDLMKRKIKILFVLRKLSCNYDGASKVLAFLSNGLEKKGFDIYCFVYSGVIEDSKLSNNIVCIKPSQNANKIKQTREIIRKIAPDVIVSFITNANTLSIVSSLGLRIPVVVCERSDPYLETSIKIKLMRRLYKFASGAVFQTEGAQNYYKRIDNSIVIPNPIEPVDFRVSEPFIKRNNSIAVVSRLDIKQKRLDIMLEAFSQIAKEFPEYKLDIYGDGLEKNRQLVNSIITNLRINDKVILHGKVKDVQNRIINSKIYFLSSDYEGIPNSLLEAMAVGLPVISTDCSPGGARLLIENGINGLLIKCGDSSELVKAIKYYIYNPDIADKYGKKALEVNEKYAPDKIVKLWEDYIRKMVR